MLPKPKIRFLTAIWGKRYIAEFCQASLPSYLAPDNLPALVAACETEVLILTTRDSCEHFADLAAFQRLESLCPVRFLLIDDLVTRGNYGVTLTLAYARGIAEAGAAQTETTFVFMNSDFILADGSLSNLARRIHAGEPCVLAASLRASAEAVMPQLLAAVDQEASVLSMPPREMVRLALANLHPTVMGKTVNQSFLTAITHNQLYWTVDRDTLLGRHFLIFMLAIRPEVPLDVVDSYCDYGFVPSMVPSGRITIVADSDEFFMMELQAAAQELEFVRAGSFSAEKVAAELCFWTTTEHRRAAETEIVFHAGALPAELEAARTAFTAAYQDVVGHMRSPAVPHQDHYFWASGLEAWARLRAEERKRSLPMPPEAAEATEPRLLASQSQGVPRGQRISTWLRQRPTLLADMPIWSHRWLDSELLRSGWLNRVKQRSSARTLLVCSSESELPAALAGQLTFDVAIGLRRFAVRGARGDGAAPNAQYDEILVHVRRSYVRETRGVLEAAQPLLAPGGRVSVFIEHPGGEGDPSNFTSELGTYASDLLPKGWLGAEISGQFAGGLVKRRLRLLGSRIAGRVLPLSLARLPLVPLAVPLWLAVAALTVWNNVQSRGKTGIVEYCSSALLTISPRA